MGSMLNKTKRGIDKAADKTKHATGTALDKTRRGFDKAVDKTRGAVRSAGRWVKKAADKIKRAGYSPARPQAKSGRSS